MVWIESYFKNQWALKCIEQGHHLIRGKGIRFFILDGDSGVDNKLTCDNCRIGKPWKAITIENIVWCSDCLPPYDDDQKITITKGNNSDESVKEALKKFCESNFNFYEW